MNDGSALAHMRGSKMRCHQSRVSLFLVQQERIRLGCVFVIVIRKASELVVGHDLHTPHKLKSLFVTLYTDKGGTDDQVSLTATLL